MSEEGMCVRLVDRCVLVHEDARRAIHECNAPDAGFSVQRFMIKERLALGKHAHARKSETFVIIRGSGIVLTSPVRADGRAILPVARDEISSGSVVYVGPHLAHTFYLTPGSEMICFSSAPFDSDD